MVMFHKRDKAVERNARKMREIVVGKRYTFDADGNFVEITDEMAEAFRAANPNSVGYYRIVNITEPTIRIGVKP